MEAVRQEKNASRHQTPVRKPRWTLDAKKRGLKTPDAIISVNAVDASKRTSLDVCTIRKNGLRTLDAFPMNVLVCH